MNKRKLLFITEGKIDEPKFIDKVFSKCYSNIKYEYYAYSTDIHTLARLLFNGSNDIDEYLDIKGILRENEKDEHQRKKLSDIYSDIILVFDFDPQGNFPEFSKVRKMLKFFNDSTNNGKLYINYPMMQSYRHINRYPEEDIEFKNRKVKISDCVNYKEIVNKESALNNLNKYQYPKIMKIVGYQLKKVNYILNGVYEVPNVEKFKSMNLDEVYNIQCKNKDNNGWIYVLNTFVFNIIEYNPSRVIEKIEDFD